MPTYEYRRQDGSRFEVFPRISDDPLVVDPETGEPVERIVSGGAGLQFKGSGFYLTDYAKKGSGGSSEAGESSSSSESKPSESTPSDSSKTKPSASTDASSASTSDD